ncbi:CBS domain-containing protein [Chloroflexota bacterium]
MGNSSKRVTDFLRTKGRPVITIGPNETAIIAIQKLVENNIGALPVCDVNGMILGVISERDLLKECSQRSRAIGSTKVKDIMTKDVVIGVPEDDLGYVMDIMTQKGIRHLLIMVGTKLEGIISMRDVVDTQLEESKATVRFLNNYILGGLSPI